MTQIIIKEYGTKIFQRDFNKTEENLIGLIKDMSLKGIISIKEFSEIFNESFNETKDLLHESVVEEKVLLGETTKIFTDSANEIIKKKWFGWITY